MLLGFVLLTIVFDQRRYSMLGAITTWMGDHWQMGKAYSQPGQFSLAIPPWVRAISTSDIVRCTTALHPCSCSVSRCLQEG